ncbi:helix-turn-helix domain-containing protein [Hymenobacter sp. YC55]|uniref:helix-turn-helix domain-containing protein n=1 Tax=Hymenobacter sp. YC55 TaxID=3034019 RepID=UPI0023F7F969|nr:helix-turn-helix domain-containing protein [Hymenobacter sp. YC55]MDF7810929.1 helix-turn-helix domain-containing protein [Hymenobacter sp. YC55]
MQTVITSGVAYAQLLEDLRALIRHELNLTQATGTAAAPASEAEELLTIRQAATLLDVCPQTVHEWKRRGLLPYHKMGGRTYLKKTDVLAALTGAQRTHKGRRGG